ncbi:hypothetical protein M404DRAFT_533844 [Pisolithus tinctorius Marx 270]|uniref:Uncharacterized protein n=1 Tax=Pisolithus tinctorius Marx 270 TaxID=870435 RepID=A0A0C3NW69_PISTI|nr:hypothetical protein M404DRAFT_533844 [Pisolithus tinctorius Marx 270]
MEGLSTKTGGKIGCAGNTKEKRERSMVVLLQWMLEMALAMRAPAVTSNKLCQVVTRLLKSLPVLVSVHAKRGSASSAQVRPQVVTTQHHCLLLHYTQERDCNYERVRFREDLCLPSFPRRSPSPRRSPPPRWC